MNLEKDILPDTIDELKRIIQSLQSEKQSLQSEKQSLQSEKQSLQSEKQSLQSDNISLANQLFVVNEKLKAALARFFSPKKDKVIFDQTELPNLFNETETYAENESGKETIDEEVSDSTADAEVITYTRKKGGKRRIPDYIPAEEIVYELSDEEKGCKCCGKTRPIIGEDRTEELDIIPAQFKKLIHIVKKYGPCTCDESFNAGEKEIIKATKPDRLIPYSIVSPGLVAYSIDYKYNYAVPYYRLSKKFEALGMNIPRATLCEWTMRAAEKCRVVHDMMLQKIRESAIINMDETRVQVLHEDGKTAESLSYMWVMKGGFENKKLTAFHYEASRSGKTAVTLLTGFKGFLQTDGYEGYSKVVEEYNLTHVGCLAHIRRNFTDAYKANKNSKTAKTGVVYISRIYAIENKLRKKNLPPGDFLARRREELRPILDEFKQWLDEVGKTILPSLDPGKAVKYALNQWEKFVRFIEHPDLTPDNNTIENAIRPFAVGRKNWLFSNTPRGAESSAIMYSLVESAKNNNLIVYNYLRYLFTNLPQAKTPEGIEKLLPCNLTPDDIKIS